MNVLSDERDRIGASEHELDQYIHYHIQCSDMPKEPTRQQLSSKLAYQANVPVFLQRLQRKIKGEDDDGEDEFDEGGSGRPPIPRRPAIPERPEGDAGSADEDDGDDGPQVVVLKAGKHLTEHEAENEKRKGEIPHILSEPT